jgi:SAM-dependent methyltransferase
MDKHIVELTDAYFSEKVEQYGATCGGVDWNSLESQRIRLEQLTRLLSQEDGETRFSICDYGCGYGYFAEYLSEKGYGFDYTGIDVSEKMIICAKEKYGEWDNVSFIHGTEIEQDYDYIVESGIFNIRQDLSDKDWTEYMISVLEEFHKHSRKGFAFNSLTKYSDREHMKNYLYYADPLFYFDYAKTHFSKDVALLHDYGLYDFTILVRKL